MSAILAGACAVLLPYGLSSPALYLPLATGSSPKGAEPPDDLSGLVARLRQAQATQNAKAKELLAYLEKLRASGREASTSERRLAFDAIQLFAELRYAPAIPYLIAETVEPKVGWINPQIDPLRQPSTSLPSLQRRYPTLPALARIGEPAASALLDEYARSQKVADGLARRSRLDKLEYALKSPPIIAPALLLVQKRLIKANYGSIDRDELDALQHLKRYLKQELLKQIE